LVVWIAILLFLSFSCFSTPIEVQQGTALSLKHDIIGLVERQFDGDLQAALSFALEDLSVDVSCTLAYALNDVSLGVLSDLRGEVDSLSAGTLKDALEQELDLADASIAALREMAVISIDCLEDELEVIEAQLDDFIDLVEDSTEISSTTVGRLLLLAKPIEQRYDYLEYIASKIRMYARDGVQDELASLLRRTVLDLADGKRPNYLYGLERLLALVEGYRGTMIKEEEADRIRDKADLLLRKVSENGTKKRCDLDLSRTVAGIDCDGVLSWEMDNYRAPSKGVRTTGLEIGAGFGDENWAISIDYEQARRDYADQLKDDSDKISHSVDLAFSWEGDPTDDYPTDDYPTDDYPTDDYPTDDYPTDDYPTDDYPTDRDPWTVAGSILLDSEFYPHDIDDEIELARVTEAIAAIQELIDEVQGLGLPAAVEDALLQELEEEGALGALIAGDRREAVDCLEDFIDEVYDAKWDGDVTPDTAQALIDKALSILPRKEIRQIKIPLSLGLPFLNGDMTLAVEWEEKRHPAHSLLNWNTVTTKVDYARKEETSTLSGYVKHEELIYPTADIKDRSLTEWEGQAESPLGSCDLVLTLFRQEMTYPHATSKKKRVEKGDLAIDFELSTVSVTANLTEKLTRYPNDAAKSSSKETDIVLSASWEVGEGAFQINLSNETKRTCVPPSVETLDSETRKIDLSWAGDITDNLKISLLSAWKDVVVWDDPAKNSRELTLQVAFDLSI